MRRDYTKILATYGAIVSSIALIWAIGSDVWKEMSAEGALQVDIFGFKANYFQQEIIDGMEIRIVNKGRRPIVIVEWGIRNKHPIGGRFESRWDSFYKLPVKLEEKELFKIAYESDYLKTNNYHKMNDVKEFFFIDSLGKETVVFPYEVELWHRSQMIFVGKNGEKNSQ